MPPVKNLLIVNPRAQQVARDPWLITELRRSLRMQGVDVGVRITRAPGAASVVAGQAAQEGYERVIVAGGDGTVNEAVNGLAGTDTAMGIVPLGTGNALGHALGMAPGRIKEACRVVATGDARRVDLGMVNGRFFVCMAGVGLDARVAADVDLRSKAALGPHAFVFQFLTTLSGLRPWRATITLDDADLSGDIWGIFVCNTAQYTWRVSMVPEARMDDGQLDFVLVRGCSRAELVAGAAAVFAGGVPADQVSFMQVLTGRHLHVSTFRPAPWQADGEVCGNSPVDCQVRPGALRLIMP